MNKHARNTRHDTLLCAHINLNADGSTVVILRAAAHPRANTHHAMTARREVAKLARAPCHRIMRVRRARARDPCDMQMRCASGSSLGCDEAQRIGRFWAWDPAKGCWPLSAQQKMLLRQLDSRISDEWLMQIVVPLVDLEDATGADVPSATASGTTPRISLRLLDWMVTNYSKSRHVVIGDFAVYPGYCTTRNLYQCRSFDPFRRRLKLTFKIRGTMYHTTVGQLNFLVWASDHNLLEYTMQHRHSIEQDMMSKCGAARKQRMHRSDVDNASMSRKPLSVESNVTCRIMRPS